MQSIFDAITEWLKALLVGGIMENLGGLFTGVNEQVGEIAAQVGMTPAAWNAGVFSMIRQLSETVILPIAGLVLTFVMTYELIQMLVDHNNLHNFDTWIFFKWIFKTFAAVLAQGIAAGGNLMGSIWTCVGYTVLLCFVLFKTGSLSKSIWGAH